MARPPTALAVDAGSPASLARFAIAARVDRAGPRSTTARRIGMTDSNFSKRLERITGSSGGFVTQVDRALAAPRSTAAIEGLARTIGHHRFLDPGGLEPVGASAHTLSLRGQWGDLFPGDQASLDVPGSLFAGLRRAGPARNSSEVTVRAAALLALLNGFRPLTPSARLAELERLGDAVPGTIDELLSVVSGPVGPSQAAVLAARFGEHCLPLVWEHLTRSPLGYRVMRVVINLLRLAQTTGGEPWDDAVRRELLTAVNRMLRDLRDVGRPDPYPGRTLTVAAYLGCPRTAEFAWTTDALHQLAWFGGTVRERGHSALALAERHDPVIQRLIPAFRRDEQAEFGLSFVADMIEIGATHGGLSTVGLSTVGAVGGVAIGGTTGSDADAVRVGAFPARARETRAVLDAIGRCRGAVPDRDDPVWLPPSVENAARHLMLVAALDVDSVRRRRACEALNAGLAGPAATQVLLDVLGQRDARLALVHQNATLSLSFLGQPSACADLLIVAADVERAVETRATALWTVGDLSSLIAPTDLHATVGSITAMIEQPQPVEVTRSAAYALALLRREPGLLAEWAATATDALTQDLAAWGCRRVETAELRSAVGPATSFVVSPLPTLDRSRTP